MSSRWRRFLEDDPEFFEERIEKYEKAGSAIEKALEERNREGKYSITYRSALREAEKAERDLFETLREQYKDHRLSDNRVITPLEEPLKSQEVERVLERSYWSFARDRGWEKGEKETKEYTFRELEDLIEESFSLRIPSQKKEGMLRRFRELKNYEYESLSLHSELSREFERLVDKDPGRLLKERKYQYKRGSELAEQAIESSDSSIRFTREGEDLVKLEKKILEKGSLWYQGVMDESPVPEYFTESELAEIFERPEKWMFLKRREIGLRGDKRKRNFLYEPEDIFKLLEYYENSSYNIFEKEGTRKRIYRAFNRGPLFLDVVPETWSLGDLKRLSDLDKRRFLDWSEEGTLMKFGRTLLSKEQYSYLRDHFANKLSWKEIANNVNKSKQTLSNQSMNALNDIFNHLNKEEKRPEDLFRT